MTKRQIEQMTKMIGQTFAKYSDDMSSFILEWDVVETYHPGYGEKVQNVLPVIMVKMAH